MKVLVGVLCLVAAACAYDNPTYPTSLVPIQLDPIPTSIRLSATNGLGASAGQVYVVAQVFDRSGHGTSASVRFSATAGTLTPETVMADAVGVAQTQLTGTSPATITASVANVSATINVSPTAPVVRQSRPGATSAGDR
jgi:hypothetical protein